MEESDTPYCPPDCDGVVAAKRLPDGPGFSPDGGAYWKKGDRIYFYDGDVYFAAEKGPFMRWMPTETGEDFSAWSDEERAIAKTGWKVRREEEQRRQEESKKRRQELRASAKAKLTAAEIDACGLD